MPLTYKGKTLNNNDIQALKDMIRSSLEAHRDYYQNDYQKQTSTNVTISKGMLTEVFNDALNGLDTRIDTEAGKKSSVNAEDIINGIFSDVSNKLIDVAESDILEYKEKRSVKSFILDTMSKEIRDYLNKKVPIRDTDEGYSITESSFHLATEPMEGIEDIAEYNPNSGRVQVLYDGRSGNSGTLESKVEDRQREFNEIPEENKEAKKIAQDNLNEALQSTAGLRAGGESARIHSAGLMNKKSVSFGDLYNVISDLNKQARLGDPDGGRLRPVGVSAGEINGVGTFVTSKALFKTLNTIADNINEIKKTGDEALRKTQAIQLASFAYNMTLSEHVFNDANGRTCRLFADTILQSFGLPPHIPQEDLRNNSKTMGNNIDFDKGARAFLQGIRQSDKILKEEKERIRQLPEGKEQLNAQVTSLEESVKKLAQEAKTKLNELDSITKKGHNNGQEYTDMYNALKEVSELNPSKNNIDSVEEAISKLQEYSKVYESTHTGLFKGRSGFGLARKNISKDLQKLASFRKDVVTGFAKDLDKNTVISNLHPEGMSAGKKVNNTDLKSVIKIEKSKNPDLKAGSTRKRSNSVSKKRTPVNSKTNAPVIKAPQEKKLTGP